MRDNAEELMLNEAANGNVNLGRRGRRRGRAREMALVCLILAGLASAAALTRWAEVRRPPQADALAQGLNEELYISPETARRMSLGFNGLIADWYWMRTLQYVGRKAIAYGGALELDDLSPLGLTQLAPLLEHATTLDPQFIPAYEYGAVVLPDVDVEAAVKLIKRGIEANPQEWRLRHHLGYIYWQRGRFREAADVYDEGSRVSGAPVWMKMMAAQMEAGGGSRDVARSIYKRMYAETDDEQVKGLALKRLLQVDSLDERDALRRILSEARRRTGGSCARTWREVAPLLRAARLKTDEAGAPLDPTGVPYALVPEKCEVELDRRSEIPKK